VKVDYIAGASASLNKTATVIMKILEDEGKRPTRRLRAFLYEKLGGFRCEVVSQRIQSWT
jgi:hypothetical protein